MGLRQAFLEIVHQLPDFRRQVPLLREYVDRQTSRRWHPVWLFDTFSRPQFRFQATDVLMNCP